MPIAENVSTLVTIPTEWLAFLNLEHAIENPILYAFCVKYFLKYS
jgi:hypothetical protein